MKTLKERTEIQQAKLDGEEIECKIRILDDKWVVYFGDEFNWTNLDYRVKTKPVEIWVNMYEDGNSYMYNTKEKAKISFVVSTVAGKTIKFIQAPDYEQ